MSQAFAPGSPLIVSQSITLGKGAVRGVMATSALANSASGSGQ